jgi:hypothetical protein
MRYLSTLRYIFDIHNIISAQFFSEKFTSKVRENIFEGLSRPSYRCMYNVKNCLIDEMLGLHETD